MNRRALLVSLTLALLGTALLVVYLRRFEREMSGGEPVELLMALRPIERGKLITDDMLTTRSVPLAYVEDRAIKAAERAKVVGLPASVAVFPQQTLMWTDLAITTEDRDLSSLIQPGKRAVAVRASTGDDTRGNQLIRPGDYVDVIATFRPEQDGGEQSSAVLLQRILVLAVGSETQNVGSDAKNRDSHDKQLTLSLSLPEAQLLSLAIERGRLSVAVRPPSDPGTVDDLPDLNASALLDTKARADVQRRPSAAQGPVRIEAANVR